MASRGWWTGAAAVALIAGGAAAVAGVAVRSGKPADVAARAQGRPTVTGFGVYHTPQEELRVSKLIDMATLEVETVSSERPTPTAPGGFSRTYVIVRAKVLDPLASELLAGATVDALWPTSEPGPGRRSTGERAVPFGKGDTIVAMLATAWPEKEPYGRWLSAALAPTDGSAVERASKEGTYPDQQLADVRWAKAKATLRELVELDRKHQPDRRARAAAYEAAREQIAEYNATHAPSGEPPPGYVPSSAVVAVVGERSASTSTTSVSTTSSTKSMSAPTSSAQAP